MNFKLLLTSLLLVLNLYVGAQTNIEQIQNRWWCMEKGKTWNCFLPNGKALTKFPDSEKETWKDLGGNKIIFKGITYEIVSVNEQKLILKTSGINFTFIHQIEYKPNKTTSSTKTTYSKNQKVSVFWKDKWYPGKIIEVLANDKYAISYDGFGAEWNETVGTDRLK